MENKLVRTLLEVVFTIVYFRILFAIIDFVLIGAPIALANILAIPALFFALIASIGLAELTVKKIKEHL